MAVVETNSENRPSRSRSRVFIVILVIILVAIAAFLIIRPSPPGTHRRSNASPAAQQ